MRTLLLAVCLSPALFAQRTELPQPQFERPRWLSLNGPWEFDFDDADAGLAAQWNAKSKHFSRKITVPFAFEAKLSGIGDAGFHRYVWYRRNVALPADWKGQRVLLHFGAVDYQAIVWVNGQRAGEHEGGNTPFKLDITPWLDPAGDNVITVRADDPPQDRALPRGKQFWLRESRGIWYTRTTGIWQPVWLEATGEAYLDRVRITPSQNGSVRFEAVAGRAKPGAELTVRILDGGRAAATGTATFDGSRAWLELRVDNPRRWSPETPNLYDVEYELRQGGQTADRVKSYFGYRTVAIEAGQFLLNGRPYYMKMVLDQGYWPESTLTAPTDAAFKFDIEAMKQMGFNGARKHQKVEDPRYLYWADKLGFLVSDEMANAQQFDETYVGRFTREWLEVVERDYNHPSVVLWIPINESWGVPDARDPRQQAHLRANYHLTKALDPTRPVIENDGWEHVDTTDLYGLHDYARTGDALYSKYKNPPPPGGQWPANGRMAAVPPHSYNGSPMFLSEFGGIAYIAPGTDAPSGAWGYAGVEKDEAAALERLRGLYEAIARMPHIRAICYTQLSDVEQEINGLLTYGRKWKFKPEAIKALNDLLK